MAEMLRMEGISKRFGSFYANNNVSLTVEQGEVHTLLGENGAGKSTLMNVLTGLYQPSDGKIFIRGKEVRISSPGVAVEAGIGMVHQHFMLIDDMTGLENIILGDRRHASPLLQLADDRATVQELMDRYGLEIDLDEKVGNMSIGMQQRVEIMKVLFRGADLLVLDEPTAVLTDLEVEGLFDIMRSLTDEGKSIIFISHKMREVMRISDHVTILRRGVTIKTLDVAQTTEQELADLMIGQRFQESTYEKVQDAAETAFELRNVSYHPEVKHGGIKDVSLQIHKGEILGVAGIDGNGQSELAALVTGLLKPEAGEVMGPDGSKIAFYTPSAFIDAGMGNIPEDRNTMGLVGDMSIAENLVLKQTNSDRFSVGHGAWLKLKAIEEYALGLVEKNDIRCTSVNQTARSLSGGNQQKVILARELDANPKLLVAVYPTRGLDIGATEFIHDQIIAQRDAGCAVLLISADFDEVLKLSDRITVLFEGQVMGTYSGANPPIKEISLAMAGK